ncbi:MAG TPA: hypothetical protein VGR87_10655 [Candidatus Limnocylindria bacterium]|jgi:hypothetical protein|nr:hypothetical protein [Candidatus Limnocylindria bacterium]
MLSRPTFARHFIVAAVSALVAMALAATAVTAHNDGFNERIVNCFDTRDADSDQCIAALEVSPVDSDFFRRLADNLDDTPAKPEPEVDVWALAKECAATQNLESQECVVAIEQSGLSVEEFKAKFAAKLGKLAKSYKEKMTSTMKSCLELKTSLNGRSPEELEGLVEKVNYVCRKALAESQMSAAQFWSKYR